ncbi:universal stress protein [Corynebacterium caspium]|uniref:universal stress protein n=1 Tax=Corynebacterium caspium TaxID=234828 RepID=UPI0003694BE4|nr:universal stress protein [Corynebacterium caspium]WKD59380.1 Universal stress protein [Corynebacterium caspium DSM 44850]
MKYTKIAVGVDGSDTALFAVRRAASLAAAFQAELALVIAYSQSAKSVLDTPTHTSVSAPVVREDMSDEYLAEAIKVATVEGAENITTHKAAGPATTVLNEVVAEIGADLLVLGNKGMKSFAGKIFGNVPTGVVQRSSVDVMLVNTEDL